MAINLQYYGFHFILVTVIFIAWIVWETRHAIIIDDENTDFEDDDNEHKQDF